MKEKLNATQNYLNIYRSLTNMKKLLESIGIDIDDGFGSDKKEETLYYQTKILYKGLEEYTFDILGINSHDYAAEVFTNMATDYAYGDDSITAEKILKCIM